LPGIAAIADHRTAVTRQPVSPSTADGPRRARHLLVAAAAIARRDPHVHRAAQRAPSSHIRPNVADRGSCRSRNAAATPSIEIVGQFSHLADQHAGDQLRLVSQAELGPCGGRQVGVA
jgi:hypothetical protein